MGSFCDHKIKMGPNILHLLARHKFALVSALCVVQSIWIITPRRGLACDCSAWPSVAAGAHPASISPRSPTQSARSYASRLLSGHSLKAGSEAASPASTPSVSVFVGASASTAKKPSPNKLSAAALTTFRMPHLRDLAWSGVAHEDNSVRKQVFLRNGEIPHVTQLARAIFPPGGYTETHVHEDMFEVFFVIDGNGRAELAGQDFALSPGSCVVNVPRVSHAIVNNGTEPMILFYFGIST